MSVLNRILPWIRSLLLRRRLEGEMREEMAEHLDRATTRLIARGLPPDEARRIAGREFGNLTSHQEEARVARGGRWLDALGADSRFALRHFARNPGATLAMLVVLAVGMSISTSLFSFLHAFSSQPPLGVPHRDDLVRIRGSHVSDGSAVRRFTLEELREYQALTSHFSGVAGWANIGVTAEVTSDAERRAHAVTATFVTNNYFELLGVRPIIGSDLPGARSEPGGDMVAVISHGAWERLFARSPAAIGATLVVDGMPVTIIGVAPPKFAGLNVFSDLKMYLPLSARELLVPGGRLDGEIFGAHARLNPGVSHQSATAAARVIAGRAAARRQQRVGLPRSENISTDVVPLLATNGDPEIDQDVAMLTAVFAGLGLLVLLVTCTNVSALQTGLAMNRRREIAIRLSMGAGRARIIRQLLTESLILATVAGAAALGIVFMIQRVVMTRVPDMPIEIVVNAPAAAFTFGIALAAGILFGLSPALHATRITVASALKDSTAAIAAPRVRLQRGLVIAQVAFTQPLIVGLAVMLLVLSGEYQRLGLGASGEEIIVVGLRPPVQASVAPDSATLVQQQAEMRKLRDRIAATPGVAGVVQDFRHELTLDGYVVHPDDRVAGGIEESLGIEAPMVAPGYFAVSGLPIVLGREFATTDISLPPDHPRGVMPVVIGAHLARALWPGGNPLGRRLQTSPDAARPGHTLAVVGVVDHPADAKRDPSDRHRIFVPPDSMRAASSPGMLVRSAGDAQALIPTLRTILREEVPRMTILPIRTMAEMDAELRKGFAMVASVLAGAGLMTLALAAIGLYAVVAFSVGQRTSEIAVRMAVGAHGRQIIGQFLGDGLRLGAFGLAVGLPLSLLGLRMLVSQEVLPNVPVAPVLLVAALGVVIVAIAGTWVPARRAAGVDPASILRQD